MTRPNPGGRSGKVGAACWDAFGILADVVACAVPAVPGGVGLATKATRLTANVAAKKDKIEAVIDTVETVVDVGTAVASGDGTVILEIAVDRATAGKKGKGDRGSPTASHELPPVIGPKLGRG